MGHELGFYPATFIMRSTDPSTLRIVDLWKFRSEKSRKWYIVEVEWFSHDFLGLKFYWKGVAESKKRYSLLTHDFEPRKIVMSCIKIMLHYFKENKCASFGFVAADNIDGEKIGINKRFRFYRRMMLSLFSPDAFVQINDKNHSIYLLVNRMMLDEGHITIGQIETEITRLYRGNFTLVTEA